MLKPGRRNRGSAMVEAAMIMPLVILILAGCIRLGITLMNKVEASAADHKAAAERITDAVGITGEDVLRAKWVIRK